jgi:probable HAF family extracellular repeat protein
MKLLKTSFLLAAAVTAINAQGQSMTDLGTFGGTFSVGWAVSADGSTAIGYAQDGAFEVTAFRWTGGTLSNLGTLGGSGSQATAVSADGSVVAGYSDNGSGEGRAFRWIGGVMSDLGTLGGVYSYARGISADGSVVAGDSTIGSGQGRAFRWVGGVMSDLGTLGGDLSDARTISADGSVVVGYSVNASNNGRAFRWTGGVMSDLGTLGGNFSNALATSSDGSVVVGYATNAAGDGRAFRWTGGVMSDLGTLGGTHSEAKGVSADGSVVVGQAGNASNDSRAFRWTGGVMSDLGTLGGNYSDVRAVSADGSVVVGRADNSSNQTRAYRWKDGVMTDLGTLGGIYSDARGVSADGSVVVGYATNDAGEGRAFLYQHRVMLDVQDWMGSVGGVHSLLSSSLELSRSFMEGAHHRPLAELGRGRSYWVTGDVASSSRTRDLRTRSGEAGATFETAPGVLLGIGAGYGRQDRDLANGGSGSTDGRYLIGEVDFIQDNGGIFSVLVSVGSWNAVTDRGYVTGGGVDFSHGQTDLQSTAIRLRYDTPVLTKALGAEINGYISGTMNKTQSDAYSETGGSYAASFGELKQIAEEGRLGVAATRKFTDKLRGRLSAEWIRRFDSDQAILTATDITSTLDLSLPGAPVQRDQARFGFDLDYLMDAKTTLSFTVHAAGRGESADVSGAISLRKGF